MFKVEAVVVGAGVIGLAIARALALRGLEVLLLEREGVVGFSTSSRNSEVIHGGLYYEPGSLKARLCGSGRRMLYEYCQERRLPHKRCGKLVVATNACEEAYLDELRQRAEANGLEELERISAARLRTLEPHLRGKGALMSPCSGIIDSHALMLSYQADAELVGCVVAFRTPVLEAAIAGRAIQLRTGGPEPAELEADLVVNSAGLDAWDFSSRLAGLNARSIPPKYLAKGNYFSLVGTRVPFRHLIYPVPEPGGLGIHLTLDLAGQARFGPDVEWVDRIDYAVDPERGRAFYASIRRYWPELPEGSLMPAYSGIRAKTTAPAQQPGDFVIQGPHDTGHPGYLALYGIESPGLTASLAIGKLVTELALG
jgi:L-2-hydroxyglutarate oxidase LhgO